MTSGADIRSNIHDIQALLLNGFPKLPFNRYVGLGFNDGPEHLRSFLQYMVALGLPTSVSSFTGKEAVFYGLSAKGLEKLGLEKKVDQRDQFNFNSIYETFPYEFLGDIGSPRARGIIGQKSDSSPNWEWGHGKQAADVFLIHLYKSDIDSNYIFTNLLRATNPQICLDVTGELKANGEGPLGFIEGISNPVIAGSGTVPKYSQDTIAPGEFVLGYSNSVGQLPLSPSVPYDTAYAEELPVLHDDFGLRRDLGKNGSFLVVQQFELDCEVFATGIEDDVAAKIVGRNPSGEALSPVKVTDSVQSQDKNAFGFSQGDLHGYHCPLGSHIRRVNPRDSIGSDPAKSIKMVNQHRILRRGRPYQDSLKKGLMFLCFNAQINRQFEFIQQNWIQNERFAGLSNERDPLFCPVDGTSQVNNHKFTMQGHPIGKPVSVPNFVSMLGGGYFFFPGIIATKFLSRFD